MIQAPYILLTVWAVQSRLDELDRQKEDLRQRLEHKAGRKMAKRLETGMIDVEASPRKKTETKTKLAVTADSMLSVSLPKENINELKVRKNGIPSNTTSYFVENFAISRNVHKASAEKKENLMKCRVHTFRDTDSQRDYQPTTANEQEEFSGKWISRRYIPTDDLRTVFKDMKILRLPKLFSKVRPPKFDEPDYANWVAIGILSFKSPIKMTSSEKPAKYFKMTLTDFKFNLDVYIFGNKNVEKYYNLKVSDVIAILNPDILPWRPTEVNNDEFKGSVVKSFNLSIRHDFDCILEIGTSRDLGFCAVYNKSSSKPCGAPINKSAEDRCQYHQEIRIRQVNAQRLELNGNKSLRSPTKNGIRQSLYGNSNKRGRKFELLPDKYAPKVQERESENMLYFSNPNSAKAFFDDSYQNPDILTNLENKRRKLKDDRKDKHLRHFLDKAVGKSSQNILHNKSVHQQEEIKSTTNHAINSGLVKNIGFDPTRGKMMSVLRNSANALRDNDGKQSLVKDVMNIRKEKIVLKPSKKERKNRLQRREEVWEHHMSSREDDINGTVAPDGGTLDESDSELEIV